MPLFKKYRKTVKKLLDNPQQKCYNAIEQTIRQHER